MMICPTCKGTAEVTDDYVRGDFDDEEIPDLMGRLWTDFEHASDGFEEEIDIHLAMIPVIQAAFRAGFVHAQVTTSTS